MIGTKINFTREELMRMPLNRLRILDIATKEEENLVQEIVTLKMNRMPLPEARKKLIIPDIKTGEQEAIWQKKLDDEEALIKAKYPSPLNDEIKEAEKKLEEIQSDLDVPVESVPEANPETVVPAVEPETGPVAEVKKKRKYTRKNK